jgi:hypothetical protein
MTQMVVSPATTAAHGAKCLDGTPPAYTIRRGVGVNASKFIIFMQGGGWCFSVADCASRRRGGLGSSNSYHTGATTPDLGGVMAISNVTNPEFHTYTMVFVHYCDGSSFSSYRPDPIKTAAGENMWFRGKANLAASSSAFSLVLLLFRGKRGLQVRMICHCSVDNCRQWTSVHAKHRSKPSRQLDMEHDSYPTHMRAGYRNSSENAL